MNPYFVIILFTLCLFFPSLKCLIIVDDVRWYASIKNASKDHWLWEKNPTWKNFIFWIANRLYSGGTFLSFEKCLNCQGHGTMLTVKANNICNKCKGSGKVAWQRKYFGKWITGIQIEHLFSVSLIAIIGLLMYTDFHSLWAALLWISASTTTQIAVWLNGRRYAVNTILILLMVACINAGGYWTLLALPLYAITPLFHMTAFCAPVLYWPSIPLMAIIVLVFKEKLWAQFKQKERSIVESARKEFTPRRLIVIVKSYGFYFFKMLFPIMTRTNYNFLYRWGVDEKGVNDAYAFNLDFYKGICAGFISMVGICYLPVNIRCYGIFMFLSTLQWCNIGNLAQIVADRYIVLANVFFQVILALWLPWWACLIVVGMNVCFVSMSYRMYENIQGMFDYHYYNWPQYTIVNREYIALCIKQGDFIKAYTMVKECLKFNPTDWDLLFGAALCAKRANDRAQARAYVELMEQNHYYGQEELQAKWERDFKAGM